MSNTNPPSGVADSTKSPITPMPSRNPATAGAVLALLTFSHGLNDLYTSFLSPLLPLLIPKFGLSLALAGLLQSSLSLTSSIAQPVFGLLTDRTGRVAFIALGPVLTALALSGLGLIPSYPLLFVILLVGGISTALFHPQAGSVIPQVAGSRAGRAMGIFIAGGTLGYSLGPLLVTLVVSRYGLIHTWYAALPAVLALPLLLKYAPKRLERPDEKHTATASVLRRRELTHNLCPLLLMWLVVVFRSTAFTSFVTYIPVLLERRGVAFIGGGMALTTFIAAGAVGTLLGGYLSDRVYSRKKAMIGLLAIAVPVLVAAVYTHTWLFWVLVALAGGLLEATNPMIVVAAQEAVPENRGVASGLMMGFGWGVGGLMVTPIGLLADTAGLQIALTTAALLLSIGIAVAFLIPTAVADRPQ